MRILIADDSEEPRLALSKVIQTEGYTVEIAANGRQALDMARRTEPDLIISDIMMPVMDGFTLCREVKNDPQLKKVPFIFYTATFSDQSDRQLAFDLGASEFILKPVNPPDFLKIINNILLDHTRGTLPVPDKPLKQSRELEHSYKVSISKKLDKKIEELERERTALKESEKRYRALALRLQEVEESERKALARELHDRVGQSLTGLNINLNIIQSQLSGESLKMVSGRLDDAMKIVEEITRRIRDVMAELRPEVLDDYGLIAALRWYSEQFSKRTGIETVIRADGAVSRLPEKIENALFYICQEALTNAAKHSGAGMITISFKKTDSLFRLIVEDNGQGFDVRPGHKPEKDSGWGLLTMQERAQGIGGEVSIESEPEKGTRVIIEVTI